MFSPQTATPLDAAKCPAPNGAAISQSPTRKNPTLATSVTARARLTSAVMPGAAPLGSARRAPLDAAARGVA